MSNHFNKRARQHGITETDLELLRQEIHVAYRDGWTGFLKKVTRVKGGAYLYKFRVSEGLFYAVISPAGYVKTVYPQEYLRNTRKISRKRRRRWAGNAT